MSRTLSLAPPQIRVAHPFALSAKGRGPQRAFFARWRGTWGIALCATVFLLTATHAHAQGCAQCLDTTQATPPEVQAAYRHAIYLLAGTATTLFTAATLLLRRR